MRHLLYGMYLVELQHYFILLYNLFGCDVSLSLAITCFLVLEREKANIILYYICIAGFAYTMWAQQETANQLIYHKFI